MLLTIPGQSDGGVVALRRSFASYYSASQGMTFEPHHHTLGFFLPDKVSVSPVDQFVTAEGQGICHRGVDSVAFTT